LRVGSPANLRRAGEVDDLEIAAFEALADGLALSVQLVAVIVHARRRVDDKDDQIEPSDATASRPPVLLTDLPL